MDLVYSVTPTESKISHSLGHSGATHVACAWSRNNLLAFSWEKVVRGYIERYISILDPNQPWNVHAIPFKSFSIKSVKWNVSGKQLLCTGANGVCSVWSVSENLTNVWRESANFGLDLHGEDVLSASWLSDGRKVLLHPDKLNSPKEKLSKTFTKPTLSQLGGQPMEGYVVMTASGMVAAKCLTQNGKAVTAKAQLKITTNFSTADIAFDNQGSIIIMATDGDAKNPVLFWKVKLKYVDDAGRLTFEIDTLPSIVLKRNEDPASNLTNISHALFMPHSNGDHVIICASDSTVSLIETWFLQGEKLAPSDLNPAFNPQAGTLEKIRSWRIISNSTQPKILSLSLPSLPVSNSASATKVSKDQSFYSGYAFAIALPNNKIKILHRGSLVELAVYHVPENVTHDSAPGRKRYRREDFASTVECVILSPASCALAVFDNRANLVMYKVLPWLQRRQLEQWMASHLTQLLYFCVITGQEWWDVLLHMQNSMVDIVCEQLTQEFSNQPTPLQQMLKSRLLAVKITIYQQSQRYSDATDCQLRLMFEAIIVVFRSLLRPPQDSKDHQAPADKLHEVCTSSFESDISMLLQSVDADTKTLQSLQKLIQWITDVALYLLAIFPQVHAGMPNVPGSSLIRDKEFVVMLRELLVIIQMWRLLKSACAPVFCNLDDQTDFLPHIFKLLTEIWQGLSSNDVQGHVPGGVVDSCCLLPNRIIIPAFDIVKPVNGVLQRLNSQQIWQFEFNRQPHTIHLSGKFAQMDFIKVDDVSKVDNLRRVYLGASPTAQMKVCRRCGITSLLSSVQESTEFWDKRFIQLCLCGGNWQVADTVPKKER